MSAPSHIFSLEEANAFLPELESRLTQLAEKKEASCLRHDRVLMEELLEEAESRKGRPIDMEELAGEIHALETALEEMERDWRPVHSAGCLLRNLDLGWVDFLGRRGREVVFFCWRRGEKRIEYYHSVRGSVLERRSLAGGDPAP